MSRTLTYTVPPAWDGRTVKDFARQHLGLSSRAFVKQKYLPGGLVKNGQPCRSVDLLRAGDRLCLTLPQDAETYQAVEGPLSILYEDQDYLAVDKPPAMPVHPSPGHDRDSLLNRVAFHYQRTGQAPAFRPLYRLDKDTSGILLVGKHRAAVSSAQVEKTYYAVCQGELSGDGTVEAPIALEPGSKIPLSPTGRPCLPRRATRCCACAWRRAAPTKSGCTWPTWATPWLGTICTAAPAKGFAARPSTAGSCLWCASPWARDCGWRRPSQRTWPRPSPGYCPFRPPCNLERRCLCPPV